MPAGDHSRTPSTSPPSPLPRPRSLNLIPWTIAAITLAIALPLILSSWSFGRAYLDQMRFHEQVIRGFASQWPRFDFHDYASATTPGYHLILTAFGRWISGSRIALQLASLALSILFIWLFGRAIARRAAAGGASAATAIAIALPLVLCPYILMSDAWLLPDNAGWLGVLSLLLLALRPQFRWIDALSGGAILAALVFTRQSHLWCAGLIWAWAWLSAGPFDRWTIGHFLARPYERTVAAAWALTVTLPAFWIVWYFHKLWGGFTPPQFQGQHTGGNLATPAFCLSLIAIYSVFFGAWAWPALLRLWREQRWIAIASAITGFVLAAVPATTFLREPRSSGLWNVVGFLDDHHITIAGRTSPLILLLSTLGAVCLAAWLTLPRARERAILLAAVLGFIAAQSFNANCWQRYLEPMFLIVLALIAAGTPVGSDAWSLRLRPLRLAGPLVLALLLGAESIHLLRQDLEPDQRKAFETQAARDPKVVP